MFFNPINYIEPVFRPPSEANSLLIQLTLGCSHNRCSYCAMYSKKKFLVRDIVDIKCELESARSFYSKNAIKINKVFICDGDALVADSKLLLDVLEEIEMSFPGNRRVGIYATARNVLDKELSELKSLKEHNLQIAYLGLESGNDHILKNVSKNHDSKDYIEASKKLKESGIKNSTMIMLGLGGREYSKNHIEDSAKVISLACPEFLSFLATTPVIGTSYYNEIENNRITPLTSRELLLEMYGIIEKIDGDISNIIFRANHVSNQFPIGGTLPRDIDKILNTLKEWIDSCPEGTMPPIPSQL